MIVGVAFVPSTPMLVPVVASGAASELDGLRAACDEAIRAACALAPERVVVLGAGATTELHRAGTGSLRGFGVGLDVALDPASPSAQRLPLALAVGAWLLGTTGWPGERAAQEVDAGAEDQALDDVGASLRDGPATALLVVADGSASRTEKAPASLHPDAAPFDAEVADALAAGDPARLAAIDRDRAARVTAAGRPAWRVAAAATAGTTWTATLRSAEAPYGVGYLVADWARA